MNTHAKYIRNGLFSLIVLTLLGVYGGTIGVASAATLACRISAPASDVTIAAGESLGYVGQITGGRSPYTFSWTFPGGTPAARSISTRNRRDSASVNYASPGVFTTNLTVLDRAGQSCSATRKVTVTAVNAYAPVITSNGGGASAAITVIENTTAVTTVTATDADVPAQMLTFSIAGGADAAKFAINAGVLSFVTPPIYATPTDVGGNNVYDVTVQVSDGSLTDTQAIAVTVVAAPGADISINSTSMNRMTFPAGSVPEQAFSSLTGYQVVAANDLGMHCGDRDHRVASILPPFNVMHAQVIKKGGSGASILNAADADVVYSASSNPNDPALANPPVAPIFKTNFWDDNLRRNTGNTLAFDAYDTFYPAGILVLFPLTTDMGLPVPDLDLLYPESGASQLVASQQLMPGISSPYTDNTPQAFGRFDSRLPFFINFPFGYTLNNVNWFAADGIPTTTIDDAGRENPYPLMRVQAKAAVGNSLGLSAGTVLASLDVVTPVSGEADCRNCHTGSSDGGNGLATTALVNAGIPVAVAGDDPDPSMPDIVSLEYAADLNILRLHDLKHGPGSATPRYDTKLEDQTPVSCQRCHYTPALDLAHVGPQDSNGREQTRNQSMSRAMHAFHGALTDSDGTALFPAMPGPVGRTAEIKEAVLAETCYQCHPGKLTRCLRGAMANAGATCQDCHGDMAQVGNDFSKNVSPDNPGAFVLDGSLRVPWANEPGCQSCHTGDALSNLANSANVIKAGDGIRLLQAYYTNDSNAKPIAAVNQRFAENQANGNTVLFRLSSGHGGVFCEGCHGSTHAEWPNAIALSNDNLAASQLQGHTGTLTECTACHTANSLPLDLNGPHGMHPVNDARWVSQHKDLVNPSTLNTCLTCHGGTMDGTVLSRTAATRTFSVEERGMVTLAKGTQVGCANCHSKPFQ